MIGPESTRLGTRLASHDASEARGGAYPNSLVHIMVHVCPRLRGDYLTTSRSSRMRYTISDLITRFITRLATPPLRRDESSSHLMRLMMRYRWRIRAGNVAFPVAFRMIRVPSGAIPARMARMAARFLSPSVSAVIECNDQAENVTISVMIPVPATEMRRDYGVRVGWISGESGTVQVGVSGV